MYDACLDYTLYHTYLFPRVAASSTVTNDVTN